MATREIVVKYKVDSAEAVQGVDKITDSFEELSKELEAVDNDLEKIGSNSKLFKALTQEAKALEGEMMSVAGRTKNITESIADIEDGLRNLTKENAAGNARKAFESLDNIVDKNVLSIQELGAAADNYKNIALAAGTTTPIGIEALKKAAQMENEMDKLNQSVAHLAEGGRGLNTAMQLGTGVLAGYSAFQGVTALVGVESEKLQETFVKLQAAQAALAGVQELKIALDKKGLIMTTLQSTAQAAYTAVVGTSTGALKAFRIALAATGIGLIIIGLGLLVANFDAVVGAIKSAVEWFSNLGEHIARVGEWLGIVKKGTADLMEAERLAAEQQRKNEEALADAHRERIKQIDEDRDAKIAAIDETIKAQKREIETLKAQGKNTDDLTLKVLEGEKAKLEAIVEANGKKIQSYIDYYTNLAALRGEDEATFKKSMLAQGIDLDALQTKANALIEENSWAVQSAENKITEFKRQQGEKRSAAAQSIQKELLAAQAKAEAAYLALERQLIDLRLANMAEGSEKELAILKEKQKREREALIKQHGENAELLEQLDIKQENELEALRDKFEKERLAKEQEYTDQLIDLRLENLEDGKDKELALLNRKHEQELEAIREKYGESTELEKELLLKQKQELDQVEKDFDEQANAEKLEAANQTLETIQGYLSQAEEINGMLNEIGDRRTARIEEQAAAEIETNNNVKEQLLKGDNVTAEGRIAIEKHFAMQEFQVKLKAAEAADKIAKKQFQREKALKLANIAIDTAGGIVKALASAPPPLGFINAGIIGGIGIAQAALVASQQFEGSAGAIQPPNFSAPSSTDRGNDTTDTASGGGSQQNNTTTDTDTLVNQPKIIISQVEINKTQQELAQIDEISTL